MDAPSLKPTLAPAMILALEASFGSVERWREEFVAMGRALGGGPGWVLLTFQPREGTLVNQWAGEHTQPLAGGVPILILDFGATAAGDADVFMDHIDWAQVYERYQQAVHAASEPFGAAADDAQGAVLLDVRRLGVYTQAGTMIPGARWCDPARVADWCKELPDDRELIVYCVYGHEVGRSTALRLRAAGLKARFLRGGIDGWQAAGRRLVPREPKE